MLSGTLERFEGLRERHETAEALASSMPGLVGLVVMTTQKAQYRGIARLGDLRLERASDHAVVWEGAAEGSLDGEGTVVTSQAAVYEHAELALRAAVAQLVVQLSQIQAP